MLFISPLSACLMLPRNTKRERMSERTATEVLSLIIFRAESKTETVRFNGSSINNEGKEWRGGIEEVGEGNAIKNASRVTSTLN